MMMSFWKRVLRLGMIAVITPVVVVMGWQEKLMYHPRPYGEELEDVLKRERGIRIPYETSQGRQVAYYVPSPLQAKGGQEAPLWLCFAGNGSLALDWLNVGTAWDPRFSYLLVDYPGYGECEGAASPERIRENAAAAVEALAKNQSTTLDALRPRLAVLGHSMGAAAALMAAADLDVRRGVLVAPFTSMTDMGRVVLGWPLCLLNRHPFDNRATLDQVASRAGTRFVIFHGTEDEVIPVRMGRELAQAHADVVTFHELPEEHHNDILLDAAGSIGRAMLEVAPGRP